ncbi:MAG: aminotransferase class V-fold PLP-dependent enzyme [archaeon]
MNLQFNPICLWRRAHKLFFLDSSDLNLAEKNLSRSQLTEKLENEVKRYFRVKHVVITSSGKEAIELVLKALHLRKSENLITQAFQCYDSLDMINKICKLNYTDTFNFDMSLQSLKKAINSNTRVIMPVNLYGIPSDVGGISAICKKNKIFLLEDCAHSMGALLDSKKVGTFGQASIFSFSKSLAAPAGGMIITNDSALYGKIRNLHKHSEVSTNYLSDFFGRLVLISMSSRLRNYQKVFPIALFFEKLQSIFRKSSHSLTNLEISLCLSQFMKLDKINKEYVSKYKLFYSMLKGTQGINLFPYKPGQTALRFPILFNEKKNIPVLLKKLYSSGCFEPSLNYNLEYRKALHLTNKKLENSDYLRDHLLVLSLDNLDVKSLKKIKYHISNF